VNLHILYHFYIFHRGFHYSNLTFHSHTHVMSVVCWSLHRSWTQHPQDDDDDTQDASSVGCGDMGQDGVNLGLPALLWAWALLM